MILATDIAVPAVAAVFALLATRHATRLLGLAPKLRRSLLLLPVTYLISDYTENVLELTLLHQFPNESASVAKLTSTATTVKSALGGVTLAAIVIGYLLALILRRMRKISTV